MEEKQSRARGRARGRGRVPPPEGGDGSRPPPPRTVGAEAKVAPRPGIHGEPASIAAPGRGVQRGAMRTKESSATGEVVRSMEAMSLQKREVPMIGRRSNYDPSMFDPRTRPDHIVSKQGVGGQPINLQSNFFPLSCTRQWCLYQYRVDYAPEVDHRGARKGMLKDHEGIIGNVFMFDGTMLFTTKKLPDKETVVYSKRRTDGSNVQLTIALTNELPPSSPISIQIYNILFRWVLDKIGMKQVGRNFYNPSMSFTVECQRVNFELWPGFITSILQYEKSVLLCAEVSHKLMRKDSVLDILRQMYGDCRQRGRDFKQEMEKFLVGQIVLTRYNNKTYRIDGIEWNLNVNMKFERKSGSVSYVDYYKEQYNIVIRDTNQPLLLSRPKQSEIRKGGLEVVHLVPELCTVTGLTDELRADFNTMKRLAVYTKQGPTKRKQALKSFIQRITTNTEVEKRFAEWGLRFEDRLLDLKGRVLDSETIMFGDNKQAQSRDASWDQEFRRQRLLKCIDLQEWAILFCSRDKRCAEDFVEKLLKVSRNMGFRVARPTPVELESDQMFQKRIRDVMGRNPKTQLICCMMPSSRKDRYEGIKKVCCVDMPVPSQVVLSRTLSKPQRVMSIATKIAIQMNCKLGGEAWAVKIPLKECMIVGFDTYHDSSQKGRSVGGFVASINSTYTRWYSSVTFQHSGVELIDGLKRCMKGALQKFHQVNGKLPARIVIYRDGVGDGQLAVVKDHEIPQLLECLKIPQYKGFTPNVSFIVVKKRVNARFFAAGRDSELMNAPPGTIIDDTVTRPEWYDFFVVSQSVREGTVSPTHYNVVYDTSTLKPDHMQRLTYKLCHLYYNWPGTIRVPAPCLYAHKIAFLVGQSIHAPVSPTLADKLYFL
nr:piwi-like protein 1 isoform X1 [Ciona intestinalis]XP_018669549.1 piwi-like protein 1 isoform X1 [Ciona intestinalis]XP_026692672.1 piwi-like protein 1 isoform X1 [Ciona intestinalis]XP_026692673.1 piwi-like protein 1 isoform X1 [Ciona intestinalis]XP_026692674.1 piwi-like protein 1 isoform X1 [Ciona intestinalis]XP_026692675.1 piwi-like protein 1 isoform X2 [Ciona intestinalis]XP_026692676.1 piwi-like protein 1 isoform X3 [Ciona intestinalis]|eukprot:XP_009860146.1 piwi-like protein 1 isoform X1 [Ciona intestinalis]